MTEADYIAEKLAGHLHVIRANASGERLGPQHRGLLAYDPDEYPPREETYEEWKARKLKEAND